MINDSFIRWNDDTIGEAIFNNLSEPLLRLPVHPTRRWPASDSGSPQPSQVLGRHRTITSGR
jgi:hypothetical protein